MQSIQVRAAAAADIPDLSQLWYEKMILQQQFDSRFLVLPDGKTRWANAASQWLADTDCAIFLAASDMHIVGYIIGRIKPGPAGMSPEKIAEITELVMDLHQQSGGVGQLLLEQLQGWCAERGVKHLLAYAPSRSAVEQAFWRASGGAELMNVFWIKQS